MKKVCIQGLGFVGSAMATAVALASDSSGNVLYDVVGVDLPNKTGKHRVDEINNNRFPFNTSDTNLSSSIKKVFKQGNFKATTSNSAYHDADIVIVDIQLDIPYLDNNPKLDFIEFKSAIQTLGCYISANTLVLIETTVPPGTCEKIIHPVLYSELKKRNIDKNSVHIAHSYERVMPGDDYLSSITDYWRVFSGHTKKAGDLCEEFLSSVINVDKFPLTRLSSTAASETAKVMENTYRAVNIAFIDEWTKYAESIGIDLFEVINAISKRPTHSNIRFPGLGVGGYCLTKDPTFAPAAAEQLFGKKLEFPFSNMAVRVNNNMPLHVVTRLNSILYKSNNEKKILVCGVSYRQDVADTRYSPSEILVRKLIDNGWNVTCHDPYVDYWDELNIEISRELKSARRFDAVIMAVPHKEYREINLSTWGKDCSLILDSNFVFSDNQRKLAQKKGVRVESIGRGDGL